MHLVQDNKPEPKRKSSLLNQKKTKTTKKKFVLMYADYGCTTGFGNVTKEIIKNISLKLGDNVEIHIFSINDFAPDQYKVSKNVSAIPAHLFLKPEEPNADPLYRSAFLTHVTANHYDMIWIINDIEVAGSMEPFLVKIKKDKLDAGHKAFRKIIYFPVDSAPLPSAVQFLSNYDEILTYTQYGKQVLETMLPKKTSLRIEVVSHGCDTKVFHKITAEKTKKIRKELFGEAEKFVIGSVNRNSLRKDFATLIRGFADFKKHSGTENAILYLHCNPIDPAGINMFRICERLNLEIGKEVFFVDAKQFNENNGVSEKRLNEIYNSFDVFITTTTAEGWGLTVTEAMAAKTPVICPIHTSLGEITDSGELVLPLMAQQNFIFPQDMEKIRAVSSIDEVSGILRMLHSQPEYYSKDKIEKAHKKVSSYTWESTTDKIWNKIKKYLK